ncbi:MAG TPA: 1-(5-phosphoribosyl)-5-[(5-phosphoribosylamino)methylideneamino]imidazole-4-carboxamide isomerase [Gammaproteobacteria bacterium]|nr:1-(5-phosphoribosyl)-5-[(5-phosphoribosylamino)methylideneamino]imidazole-4-carboxamide isomerase [Gammaproteobacteria bacterium]
MIVYPAIDLRFGKCVRLWQGDYTKETVYSHSPIIVANKFKNEGATWLHLVDLNGANSPDQNQAPLIKELLHSLPLKIQMGGGIRTAMQVEAYLASGAKRVVVGSLAIESPEMVIKWLKQYGNEQVVVALDVYLDEERNPCIATQGWQKKNKTSLFDVLPYYIKHGLKHTLCTDISRDGVLSGPNIELYQTLLDRFPSLQIQASGGISSLDDIRCLKNMGLSGAIIGRALYEKKYSMREALLC